MIIKLWELSLKSQYYIIVVKRDDETGTEDERSGWYIMWVMACRNKIINGTCIFKTSHEEA